MRHTNSDAFSKRPWPEGCSLCQNVKRLANDPRVRLVVTVPAEGWVLQVLRREKLADNDLWPLGLDIEAGRPPEWWDIINRGQIYKSYWSQRKSLVSRYGVLVPQWGSVDGRKKTIQVVVPKAKWMGSWRSTQGKPVGQFGSNRSIGKFRQRYYWLRFRDDVESCCRQCKSSAVSRDPRTRRRSYIHQYNFGATFERFAVDNAGPFQVSVRGNRYLLVAMEDFKKWPQVYAIRNQFA